MPTTGSLREVPSAGASCCAALQFPVDPSKWFAKTQLLTMHFQTAIASPDSSIASATEGGEPEFMLVNRTLYGLYRLFERIGARVRCQTAWTSSRDVDAPVSTCAFSAET